MPKKSQTKTENDGLCNVTRCRQGAYLGYIHNNEPYRVCRRCWEKHCDDETSFNLQAPGTLLLPKEEA